MPEHVREALIYIRDYATNLNWDSPEAIRTLCVELERLAFGLRVMAEVLERGGGNGTGTDKAVRFGSVGGGRDSPGHVARSSE